MLHDYSVLVLVEPDFHFKAKDVETYLAKLKTFLLKRAGDINLRVVTVEGKYGIPGVEIMQTDNRNKTAFIKAIEDIWDNSMRLSSSPITLKKLI